MPFKCLYIILFFFYFTALFSQPRKKTPSANSDTLTTTKGAATILVVTRPNSKFRQTIRLKNGKKHGAQEITYDNGLPRETVNYRYGFPDGEQIFYDNQGNISERRIYKFKERQMRSVLEGPAFLYRNKKLISETAYKDSLKNGIYKEFFPDGGIKVASEYRDNLLSGHSTTYHSPGKNSILQHFKIIADEKGNQKSVLHGKYEYYEPGGSRITQGAYDNGKKTGLWIVNQPNGVLISKINYRNDQMFGPFVKYFDDGKLETQGIFYYEIEIDGKKRQGVYDGKYENFFRNGNLQEVKNYKMGKLDGLLQRFYDNGQLKERRSYTNGLEVGTMNYFDANGLKSMESTHGIIIRAGVEVSVKQGFEYHWQNGTLTTKLYFEDGLEQGIREVYYPSGKLQTTAQMKDGLFSGAYFQYYESGQSQVKNNYLYRSNTYDGKPRADLAGWQLYYDETGHVTAERFYDQAGKIIIAANFIGGQTTALEIPNTLYGYYFPNGKLMSLKLMSHYNRPVAAYYYYLTGKLRKISFQDDNTSEMANADFSDEGTLLNVYRDNNTGKPFKIPQGYPQELAKSVNRDWIYSALFTDAKKEGKYHLNYSNQKPLLEMAFLDNLPHGKFLVYHPNGDTLVYKNYYKGILRGDFVEKFAGKKTVWRGKYHNNGEISSESLFNPNGKPSSQRNIDSTGKTLTRTEYYENGALKTHHDETNGTSVSISENGFTQYETTKVAGREGWLRIRQYFPDSRQINLEQFRFNNLLDSIQRTFHKNGQLYSELIYANNKKNGNYIEYTENGTLKKKGQYLNDEMVGEWLTYNNVQPESSFYENGKLVVKPPDRHCACIDTSMSGNKIRFVPTLDNILEFKKMLNAIPPFIKPIDNFNYDSIFADNYQFSNGANSGFTSVRLIMFKEFSFFIPADQQVRITLNPCRTTGYISNMEVAANYSFNNDIQTSATFRPKRIAVELVNSPLKSNEKEYANFTALFDTENINFRYERELKVDLAKQPNACYTIGMIKNFIKVEVIDAKPSFFDNDVSVSSHGNNPKQEELNRFFGLLITRANLSFDIREDGKIKHFNTESDYMLAGGKFVSGRVNIACSKTSDDTFASIKDLPSMVFSAQNLKKEFMRQGLTRVDTAYDEARKILSVQFFAE